MDSTNTSPVTGTVIGDAQIIPPHAAPTAGDLHLFYEPVGTLRLTIGDLWSYPQVKLFQSAPLSQPGKYLSLQSGKGEEIVMVPSLEDFTPEARAIVEEEIRRRYLTAKIQMITGIRTEFGVTYWHVETDRGPRDFVMQSLSESCIWLSDSHLLLIDVDGNRFEIPDRTALDTLSKTRLASVL
jgi:hypothetical protein